MRCKTYMTPEEFQQAVDLLLARQTIESARTSALEAILQSVIEANGLSLESGKSVHEAVLDLAKRTVHQQLRDGADNNPHMANKLAAILREFLGE